MSDSVCITCGELVVECRCMGRDCPDCGKEGSKEDPCVCPTTGPLPPSTDAPWEFDW